MQKMINYDHVAKENIKKLDHEFLIRILIYWILIAGSSGSGKTNVLLNLIKQQHDDDYNIIGKIYLYVKDPNETKYQYLIKKR